MPPRENGVSPPDRKQRPGGNRAPSSESLSNSRVTRIEAQVRIGVTAADLDESGQLLHDVALRRIRGLLDGLPVGAWLTVDLGPLRVVDSLLMAFLADVHCAKIVIVGPDWRLAERAVLELHGLAAAS